MVPICPPSYNSFSKPLETVPITLLITIGITVIFIIHNFLVLWQSSSTCFSFRFLWFSLSGLLGRQSPLYRRFYYYYYYYYYYYCFTSLTVFLTSISWWSFSGVWVSASLLKFPRFFSVFWLILTVLSFEWSPLIFLFPILPVSSTILYQTHRLQLLSPSPSSSMFFFSFQARSRYLSLFSPSFNFTLWSVGTAESTIRQVFFVVVAVVVIVVVNH